MSAPVPQDLLPSKLPSALRPRLEKLASLAQTTPDEVWGRLSPAGKIGLAPREERRAWLEGLTREHRAALKWAWGYLARPDQLTPPGQWLLWLVLAGRGWGKTRTGSQFTIETARENPGCRIALVGSTSGDVRDVMIEGESGILAASPPGFRPTWEPSKRRLTWPNGSRATSYSADKPERLRGPQFHAFWADEVCAWRFPEQAWEMLQYGVRLGKRPRGLVTTTPRPIKLLLKLLKDAQERPQDTVLTKGSTYDNVWNLAAKYVAQVLAKREGRLARQEIFGDVLDVTEGALWNLIRLDILRVRRAPALARVVVAVDPAEECGPDSDEVGIVGAGRTLNGHGYVLADRSLKGPPSLWARTAYELYLALDADAIVVETNRGGKMVAHTIRSVVRPGEKRPRIIEVKATRGKATRAEPISAIYEEGRGHHVGNFPPLEDEMCSYVPGVTRRSPNRMDALVWAFTELFPVRKVWN